MNTKQVIRIGDQDKSSLYRFPGEAIAGETYERNIRRSGGLYRRTEHATVFKIATGGYLLVRGWREVGTGEWRVARPQSFDRLGQVAHTLYLEDPKKVGPWAGFRRRLVTLSVTT